MEGGSTGTERTRMDQSHLQEGDDAPPFQGVHHFQGVGLQPLETWCYYNQTDSLSVHSSPVFMVCQTQESNRRRSQLLEWFNDECLGAQLLLDWDGDPACGKVIERATDPSSNEIGRAHKNVCPT